MQPPGFVVDHRRRISVAGSHGVGHGGFPICMEPVSGGHGHQGHQNHQNNNNIHVPLPKVENHDARSRLPPMSVGTMVMTSEPWTMATHRHMTLIAQGHQSRRVEWPIPPQSCPPGFRPPGMYFDESAVVHPQQHPKAEVNFRSNNEGMIGRENFSRNNWGDDPLEKHLNYVHGISSSTGGGGSVSNRGWFADDSLSNSGGVMLENRVAAYPHKLPPALHLPQPQGDRAQEHALDPDLTWKERWREQPHSLYSGQPPPPPPPLPGQPGANNNIIPNSSYFGDFPPKIPQEENAATIRDSRNRRHVEGTNGNLQEPPPPKRSRKEEVLGMRSYRIPQHALEVDSDRPERPDQVLVVADNRSLFRDQSNSHHYSLEQKEKHLEERRSSISPKRRGDSQSLLGRQLSKTRHNPSHDFHAERGPGSHHAKYNSKFPSESHRDLQLHSRSNFPPTPPRRQSGDSHLRVRSPPRGNHSYHIPSSDNQIRDKIGDGRSFRQGRASRSPCAYQHQSKRRSWENDCRDRRAIQLLTGKRNVMGEFDERVHSRRRVVKTEGCGEPNGTTALKPSGGLVGATKEECNRSSSQLIPNICLNENSHISAMSKKVDNNSKIAASGLVSKVQSQSLSAPFVRDDSDQFQSNMMVLKAEQSGVLDTKMMTSHKNARQHVKGKGSLSTGCHGWKTEENKAVLIKPPAPRGCVKIPVSTSVLEKIVSQDSEVDVDCPPEKVTVRRRRGGSVTRLQSTAANPSRAILREDLLMGKQEFVCQRTDSIKSGQIEDDGQKQLLRCRNGAGNLQGGKEVLENVLLEALNFKQSETREDINTETSLSKQPVLSSKLSFEAKPHKLHGRGDHSAVKSDIGNGGDGRSGQTVIFTGHKAEPFPKVLTFQKTATGSGSLSSPSLAKTHTPSVRLSRERSGTPCSQPGTGLVLPVLDMKEKGRSQLPLQTSGKMDSPKSRSSVLTLEPTLPDKNEDGRSHQNNKKSEVAASTPSTRNDEGRILFAEASDGVKGQDNLSLKNLENSETVTSIVIKQIEEGARVSGKGSDIVEFTRHLSSAATKKPPEGSLVKNSSLDIANTQPRIEYGFDAATNISVAQPLLPPDCPAVQEVLLFGTNLNAKSIVVQAEEVSPAKCSIEEARQTDLEMIPLLVGNEQVNGACTVNVSGAVSVATGVMNEVLRDDSRNVVHHIEARHMAPKQPEESNGNISNGEGHLAKRQKLRQFAKEKKLLQKTKEVSTPVENDTTGEGPNHVKASKKPVVQQLRSRMNGDVKLSVVSPKGVDATPISSYPSIKVNFTAQTQPPISGMGWSYGRNKIWRMGPTAPSSHFSNNQLAKKSAVSVAGVSQQAAYVRKRYSIIRLPPPQNGAPMRAVVPPAVISGTRDTAPEFGRTISASTKPNVMRNNNNVSQSDCTGVKKSLVKSESTLNTNGKTVEQGVASLEQLSPLLSSKSSMPLVEEDSKRQLDLINSNATIVSELKFSEARMLLIEPKAGLALSASSPARTLQDKEARASEHVVSGTRSPLQGKVNQLIVAPSPESGTMLAPIAEKSGNPLGSTPADFYVKMKINQLIRCSGHENSGKKRTLQDEAQESGERVKGGNKQRKGLSQLKTKHGRATVWTLSSNGRKKSTGTTISRCRRWPTLLFPWKRMSMALYLSRRRPLCEGKKGPSVFYLRNKLQRYRSGHPIYTRSADGFSLHRSGVVSQCGANLKWTKSLEKQSIFANELATKVVLEAEKKKRDRKEAVLMAAAKARAKRRAVQSLATSTKLTSRSATTPIAENSVPSSVSVSEMSQNGGAVYVRKGFGNQLVRDMKTSRGLANEKVRWSLHNARFRKAKKQAYCVYYTRFGQCKRGDDKCLYIHDRDKVAVCTKFLRDLCSDPKCTLTHKVIPERMSDCSYFLEGLCTNEKCPYRHVNVNPKAPVCEGFLQGYCADGDMCNKKHTYVCPEYIEKGECSHSDTCKRRHPKKVKQASSASKDPVTSKREHRYFMSTFPLKEDTEGQEVPYSNSTSNFTSEWGDDWTDFISIDDGGIEVSKKAIEPDGILHERSLVQLSRLPKDQSLIKPRFLLKHLEASG